MASASVHCPSPEMLTAFLRGDVSGTEAETVVQHLEQCPECLQALERQEPQGTLREMLSRSSLEPTSLWSSDDVQELKPRLYALLKDTAQETGPVSAAAEAEPEPELERLGRFEIRRVLGRGGFGLVYLAFDPILDREVALKLPYSRLLQEREHRTRFIGEARAAGRLQHPNIVAVYEAGTIDGMCYLAAAYCAGPNLAQWLRQHGGRLSAELAARIAQRLADAVEYAHLHGVLHRDIKPANVLLDQSTAVDGLPFEPMITDFGVAKLLDSSDSATVTGQLIGTPRYMAPEQATGNARQIGPATDVYGLGVLLYQLLSGRLPIEGETNVDVLRRIVSDSPRPLRKRVPEVPRDLEAVCLRCLEKDPQRRYASARELADDLQRYLDGESTRARPMSAWERSWRWARRYPAWFMLVATVLLATVGAVWGLSAHSAQLSEALVEARDAQDRLEASEAQLRASERQLRQRLYAARMRLAGDAWQQNDIVRMREALRQQIPDSDEHADLRGFEWYYLWQQSGMTSQTLIEGESALYVAGVSPNHKWLAFTGADARIHLFEAGSLSPLQTIETEQVEVNGLAFSPDSRLLASAGDDGSVAIWDTATWTCQRRFPAHEAIVYQVAFSQDGTLLFSAANEPVMRVWDVKSGGLVEELAHHGRAVEALSVSRTGLLAAASDDKSVSVWEMQRREVVRDSGRLSSSPNCVALSADGRLLAIGEQSGWLTVRDLETDGELSLREQLPDQVYSLAFSPDADVLAAGTRRGDVTLIPVHLTDTADEADSESSATAPQRRQRAWHAHDGRLYGLAFTPDGRGLLTAASDGVARVWSLGTGAGRRTLALPAVHAAFSTTGDLLVADDALRRHSSQDIDAWETVTDMPGPWICVDEAEQTGRTCARHREENAIYAWDAPGQPPTVLWRGESPARASSFAVSPDGSRLAVQHAARRDGKNSDFQVALYDLPSRRLLKTEPSFSLIDMRFSPDGRWLVCSRGAEVFVIDAESGRSVRVFDEHRWSSYGVAFTPDSRTLASIGGDRQIILRDVQTGRQIWTVLGHGVAGVDLDFSPDGQTLATVGADGVLRFWLWRVQELMLEVPIPAEDVRQVEFSPDGRRLMCRYRYGRDGQVLIFDSQRHSAP